MKIEGEFSAGRIEKRDCFVKVKEGSGKIQIKSKTGELFREHIEGIVSQRMEEIDVIADVEIEENGAVDYVIIARVESALAKATMSDIPDKKMRRGKTAKDRVRRSRLYVPGNNPRFINSVAIYGSDCTILDMEDSVPVEQKQDARYLVKNALKTMDFGKSEIWVRINKEMAREDMNLILYGNPHGICIPKVESKEDVEVIEKILNEINLDCHLMPIIETAKGIKNVEDIANASERIVALAFGAEDYTRDIGGVRKWETLLYPRCRIVVASKSANIQALDTIYPNIEDMEGLIKETKEIIKLGFDGKGAIHPGQIEAIHECFMPSPEEIEEARKIVDAIERARKEDRGVATLNGKMIDLPVENKARRILKLAEMYRS
ncbi:MAG TPA: citrate lyase ACP [Thermoplasmatales archaeon]|nr:citrate lyase ACP [Thermoplasmatales archaeon]